MILNGISKGSDLRNFLVHGDDKEKESVLNELIENNREENTDSRHRKVLNDFYHHNILNYDTFSDNTKQQMKGVAMRLQEEGIQGSQAMINFTHSNDLYKPNLKTIKNDVMKLPKSEDLSQKLDGILNKYTTDIYE